MEEDWIKKEDEEGNFLKVRKSRRREIAKKRNTEKRHKNQIRKLNSGAQSWNLMVIKKRSYSKTLARF